MISTLFSMLWSLVILVGFLIFVIYPQKVKLSSKYSIHAILIVTIIVRVIPILMLGNTTNFDIESYRLVSSHVVSFEDVYTAEDTINRHPYLPFQMYWLGSAKVFSEFFGIPYPIIVKLLSVLADCGIVLLIIFILRKTQKNEKANFGGFLYALNPISVFVTSSHGQFGSMPLFFILLSIYFLQNKPFFSGLWLGLGVLNKSWPVLFFPIAWENIKGFRQKVLYTMAMIIPPGVGVLLYSLVYDARIFTVVKRAISYNHGIGVWGYTYLLKLLANFSAQLTPIIYKYFDYSKFLTIFVLIIVWVFVARKRKPELGFLIILITFFTFSHAFSIQYLVWIIPFAIINTEYKWLMRYTLAAFSYMFLVYNTLINNFVIDNIMNWPAADLFIIIPASLPIWLICIFWFASWLKKIKIAKLQN